MEAIFDRVAPFAAVFFFGGILLAFFLCLAFPLKKTKKILSWIAPVTVIIAFIIYGLGYGSEIMKAIDDPNVADPEPVTYCTYILLTVWDSCRIFGGSNNWDVVKDVLGENTLGQLLFWVVHLLAISTSAGAVIMTLGSRLLKKIRINIYRKRDIALIYGLSENTLEFGLQLMEKEESALIYVDESGQTALQKTVDQMSALLRSDADALSGNVEFLKDIGLKPGNRKLHVYALNRSMIANQRYATRLLESLKEKGITPEQTTLTMLYNGDETENPLQATESNYGYGSVISVNEPEMVARILVRQYPPCKVMDFDENGKATKGFHGVIIGFGRIGQAVLKQLVMNSQFYDSKSRITVFAPDYKKRMGWLTHECPEMLKHYAINLKPYDGRSNQLYNYLEENIGTVNYVAVCAGGEIMNMEIAEKLQTFLNRRNCAAPILMCSQKGIVHYSSDDVGTTHPIYTPELLCTDQIDRMAMILNQSYIGKGDMRENWKKCNYFDRMSSRAAADFMDALLCAAGVTRKEALESWDPKGQLLENLAASEHLRWNAFHYFMGFRPMTEEEFEARSKEYLAKKDMDPKTPNKIRKDMEKRIHACIIPWKDLDAFSAKENAITKGSEDYAENDRKNVRDIRKILRMLEENK